MASKNCSIRPRWLLSGLLRSLWVQIFLPKLEKPSGILARTEVDQSITNEEEGDNRPGLHWFPLVHIQVVITKTAVLTSVMLIVTSSVPDKAYGHIQSTLFAKQGQI